MTLPTITLGGEDFYDMSSIISPNRYTRPGTIGIALHHSVGAADFPDRNMNGTNTDEEEAHIKAIEIQHVAQDFGGFGYNAIAFDSGRVYVAGDCMGARAHAASRNGELEGICMAGDYRTRKPSASLVEGVRRYYWARAAVLGEIPIKGHREWAIPGWETSCPGDAGAAVIATILEEPDHSQVEDDMTEDEVKAIAKALYDDRVSSLEVVNYGVPYDERDADAVTKVVGLGGMVLTVASDHEWREDVTPVIDASRDFQHAHAVGSTTVSPDSESTSPDSVTTTSGPQDPANPFR